MRGPKKKSRGKWDSHNTNQEKYANTKKEKEFLMKYKNIAGEYLEDWELIELFKKSNFDDEQISKELNKIKLGDEFKWKEIKNGKAVTTRSTDQIRKKKYYRPEKLYDKTEDEINEQSNTNNKRKGKGSYHKSNNDYYYYASKKPKRPFQKCIEVPSDYRPQNSNQDNKIINSNNYNNVISSNNVNITNNINSENSEKENQNPFTNDKFDDSNKMNIKHNIDDKSDEEQKKILIIKGQVFKNLKKIKTNTELKKRDNIDDIYSSSNENNNKSPGPEINIDKNNDLKKNKEIRTKYFRKFFGYMKHYCKRQENNIKRANSKDSETSNDRSPETTKRKKRSNIPISSNIIHKKNRVMNGNGIARNLRNSYGIEKKDIEFESKVINISINSCYDNPYRGQYLKLINEKKKKNPGKEVEFIIPQFSNPFMQQFPSPYPYNPYFNQNIYMYPPQFPIQPGMPDSKINSKNNPTLNSQMNFPMNPQMSIPQFNKQNNPQFSMPIYQNINSPINSPLSSQMNIQMSPKINQHDIGNNYIRNNDPQLLSPQSNNAPNPQNLISNNLEEN